MKSKVSPTQRALNMWAVVMIIWAIYRAKFHLPVWFDEFVAKPIVFILPVYWYVTHVEKTDFFEGIWFKSKQILPDLLYGLAIGGIFFASAVASNFFINHKLTFFNQSFNAQVFFIVVITALATSISEEILSRGFILKRLYEDSHNIITSSFFASILFFFIHVPVLFTSTKITGNLLLLIMATDLILSMINSFIFLKRKSLTLPILIHAMYNITILLVL